MKKIYIKKITSLNEALELFKNGYSLVKENTDFYTVMKEYRNQDGLSDDEAAEKIIDEVSIDELFDVQSKDGSYPFRDFIVYDEKKDGYVFTKENDDLNGAIINVLHKLEDEEVEDEEFGDEEFGDGGFEDEESLEESENINEEDQDYFDHTNDDEIMTDQDIKDINRINRSSAQLDADAPKIDREDLEEMSLGDLIATYRHTDENGIDADDIINAIVQIPIEDLLDDDDFKHLFDDVKQEFGEIEGDIKAEKKYREFLENNKNKIYDILNNIEIRELKLPKGVKPDEYKTDTQLIGKDKVEDVDDIRLDTEFELLKDIPISDMNATDLKQYFELIDKNVLFRAESNIEEFEPEVYEKLGDIIKNYITNVITGKKTDRFNDIIIDLGYITDILKIFDPNITKEQIQTKVLSIIIPLIQTKKITNIDDQKNLLIWYSENIMQNTPDKTNKFVQAFFSKFGIRK